MSIWYYKIGSCKLLEIKKCQNELQAYKDHLHEELSIGFIEKGATNLKVNGKEYYIKAGEAIVIYPFVSHICQPIDLANWKFTMIYINKDFYKDILEDLNKSHFMGIKKLNDEDYRKINYMIDTMKGNESLIEKEEKIVSVLADIFINCDINIELVKDKQLEEIRKYIEINFLEQLKLDDIVMHFGLNKFGIIRSFKNRYNATPAAYQLQLRVNYAKHLIEENPNLVQVALNSGFYDQAHFTKEFKRAYGLTPKQYLKSIK
ncbi:AraC family transcriptional regulator [Clostridium magnum]|uniref:Exoenzyme S synthesis regulatory protein ExsA n=1 Tax=Clostridium magnum DSM 2767 TaxID=1121326 RepID=A0A162TBZ0_9CLOT|nr:AraC family transcriptional regulator [Clostridium magnum]KZL92450.1 exoenzyme S synthesis regulatory protein ExsA [Clostridium magnum DSM 2767]SHI26671.1 AraC-type DNA-binding protein [Clostridium magnum DSM 2767]